MKKQILLSFLFLLFCSTSYAKSGEEIAAQIAPLLNERTILVIHIDLSQIDFRDVCEKATSQLEPFLASLNIDEKSIQGIAREAKKILRKGEKKIQNCLDTLIDKCGVTDVYYLGCDAPETDESTLDFFAIPLENRTVAQRNALASFLKEIPHLEDTFLEFGSEIQEHDGFQVFGTFSPERYREIPDQGNAKVQAMLGDALKQTHGATLRAVMILGNINFIESNRPGRELEHQLGELLDAMTKKLKYGVFTFDISRMECTVILQANLESDAKDLEQDFQTLIELYGELAKESIQEDQDMAFLAPLVGEFLKGSLKAAKPNRDGSRFVVQYENDMIFSAFINTLVGAAHFVLP